MKPKLAIFLLALLSIITIKTQAQIKEEAPYDPNEEVLQMCEVMPQFKGGNEEMYKYISKNLNYPKKAREAGVEGKVIFQFVVDKKGKIKNIEQLGKKLGAGCDEEALRVIRNMPNWTAGTQNGRAVNVLFTLPFRFALN